MKKRGYSRFVDKMTMNDEAVNGSGRYSTEHLLIFGKGKA